MAKERGNGLLESAQAALFAGEGFFPSSLEPWRLAICGCMRLLTFLLVSAESSATRPNLLVPSVSSVASNALAQAMAINRRGCPERPSCLG